MDSDAVQRFVDGVTRAFAFLEREYNYKLVGKGVKNENYFLDAEAIVRYAGSTIGVEIFWYFASSVIGVAFAKLEKGEFSDRGSGTPLINLYALADYLSEGKEGMFLLKDLPAPQFQKLKSLKDS